MNKIYENCFKLLIISLICLNSINCRKLTVNKFCQNVKDVNLIDIQSDGEKDTIHYLWSSTKCIPPTLLIVKTGLKSNSSVDCGKLLHKVCSGRQEDVKKAIQFDDTINSIGFQFNRLFFFNDIMGKGSYKENDTIVDLNWNDFEWTSNVNDVKNGTNSVKLSFKPKESDSLYNASIAFDLRVDSSDGRNEELPHLAFTQKSVSLEFSIGDAETDAMFNATKVKPRLMAEIYVMKDNDLAKKADFESITSIDDEYTPGVFSVIKHFS